MENEVYIKVSGMRGKRCENKIVSGITQMPGVEFVDVSAKNGTVSVTGGDIDQLQVVDIIEGMGYKTL